MANSKFRLCIKYLPQIPVIGSYPPMRLDARIQMRIIVGLFENHGMPPTRMSTVVRLADYKNANRRIQPDICFDKKEFDQLLSVYSRWVMSGDWKDYAIRHDPTMAAFLI